MQSRRGVLFAFVVFFLTVSARDWVHDPKDLKFIESRIEKSLGISRRTLKNPRTW